MATNAAPTALAASTRFRGEISGGDDLYVNGEMEGQIQVPSHVVTIGPQARVKADLHAREVRVEGRVEGSIVAGERIEVTPTGAVTGEMRATRISLQDGAFFQGSMETGGES